MRAQSAALGGRMPLSSAEKLGEEVQFNPKPRSGVDRWFTHSFIDLWGRIQWEVEENELPGGRWLELSEPEELGAALSTWCEFRDTSYPLVSTVGYCLVHSYMFLPPGDFIYTVYDLFYKCTAWKNDPPCKYIQY